MIDHAVHLQGVEKRYKPSLFGKGIYALRGVDIDIPRGAIFGLLGPNGAGKSTLVKIMMTVIKPTVCRGTILGQPVGDKSTLSQVGYLPEHHRFPDYLTAAQVVDYFGSMSGLDRATRRTQMTRQSYPAHRQRFRAHLFVGGFRLTQPPHPAEPARVTETQLCRRGVGEAEDEVRVR